MITKLIERYLTKRNQVVITKKQSEHIPKYRATRGELRKAIDNHNEFITEFAKVASIKQLKELLAKKNIKDVNSMTPDELRKKFIETYKQEFKKA